MNIKGKRLIIIAGANGTGKTTLANEFLKKYKIYFLNADEIAKRSGKIQSPIKAGKIFLHKLTELIKKRKSAAVESTLAGQYLVKTIKKIKPLGYRISIIYFFVDSPEIALARIQARVKAGGHNIPKTDVLRRFYRSKANFWKLYRNLADEWTIFYNGNERLAPVATGEKANCEVIDEVLFALFKKGVK
jgi:predicted ABC-type ATPase